MQLLRVKSISRYLPPKGTAAFERCLVRGLSLSPAPPAIIRTIVLSSDITSGRAADGARAVKIPFSLISDPISQVKNCARLLLAAVLGLPIDRIGAKMGRLEGKAAIVTGGSGGIGRATALAFAKEGARVAVVDVAVPAGEETVQMIRNAGGEGIFIKADVTRSEEVKAMADRTFEAFGRLDCAFNNAGVNAEMISVSRCTEESWDRMIDINLKGVFLCMKYEIPRMLKSGGGSIVNTASVMGLVGEPGHPAYAASKHGVVGLSKSAAIFYAQAGIRINAVCPGAIHTSMVDKVLAEHPELKQTMDSLAPMNRMAEADEVARAVIFLCSDDASYITGHPLAVDGGWVAR
jgi:NAD(P)-dependent dehydrogenase (short-subunit alcohol dehydrogenase family)